MFIREAIREFHDAIAMPVMAPIVVEQPAQSGAAARYAARTSARLDAFERHVAEFDVASRNLTAKMRGPEVAAADDEDLAEISDFIGYVERMAERMAIDGARTEKDMTRDAKRQESRDGSLALAHRQSAIRLAELNAHTVESLLALAIDMRALRASLTPSKPSPTFDDADELGRYLDGAMRG